jgi:hypothetical protein
MKNNKGGNVLASGGYGCVFSPALQCEEETHRSNGKISKLMSERHATEEYEEINSIKQKLNTIKNYQDYYLIYDATLCKPKKLTESDLTDYSKKCTALPKNKITKENINENLDKLLSLNIPNGGVPVDDYIYNNGTFEKVYVLHRSLVKLLKKGIIPMNNKNIYHCDIKDSNVLVDESVRAEKKIQTRLIDWGLCTEYKPFKNEAFPKTWRNRPLQFNVPFSVILFSDSFVEKYTNFIKDGGKPEEARLTPFVIDYVSFWMKERGAGHYKFINEMMYTLFSNSLTNIAVSDRPTVVETQITMEYIVNYIVNVLVHYTKFRNDGTLNLRDYLDNVFIKIVDIWGFIALYFPIIELLFNNYTALSENELKIFNKIQYLFVEYLYKPRITKIDINLLYKDLNDLGGLIQFQIKGTIQTDKLSINSTITNTNTNNVGELIKSSKNIYNSKTNYASKSKNNTSYHIKRSLKTKRNLIRNNTFNKYKIKSNLTFKRRPKQKRFRNPIFLSLK